jgi:hypothetical protein
VRWSLDRIGSRIGSGVWWIMKSSAGDKQELFVERVRRHAS